MAAPLAGCSGSEDPAQPNGEPGVDVISKADTVAPHDAIDAADAPVWDVCEPGAPKECVGAIPTTTVLACNTTGTAYTEQTCKDANGDDVWCLNGACAECIPGAKACKGDDTVLECDETGRLVELKSCSAEKTGQACIGGNCISLCEENKKFNSYLGCEYWAVDLDNAFVQGGAGYLNGAGAQFSVVVANPHPTQSAEVAITKMDEGVELPQTLDSLGDPLPTGPIAPGALRIFNLPRRDADGTMLASIAYRVESTIPVTAYQFNPLENEEVFSNDASLLLPVDVLGRYYIVMTREQTFDQLRGFLTVVAVRDDTQVAVTVTAPTLQANGIAHMKAGETATFKLNRYDVLNLETDEPGADLTGSVILATNNVAVFAGSEASNAPNTAQCDIPPGDDEGVCAFDGATYCRNLLDCIKFNTCCADHLEQQLFPVKTWGMYYVATKTKERGKEKDIWRILAAEDDTKVTLFPPVAGVSVPVLNSGEWFELETTAHFEITANKPVMVGQFLAAEDAPDPNVNGTKQPGDAGIGDPAFILAVPVEQYRSEYVVLAPNKYELDYINITAPKGAVVVLDGEEIPESQFETVSSSYRVARLPVADGEHTITSDKKVGVIVYGYDKYVSYGYPGGLDLRDLGLIKETGE